jgi:hypothetical protein
MNRAPTRKLLLLVRLQRVQRFLHQLSPQLFFLRGRQFGIAGHMDDAGAQDDAVGADHLGDWLRGGNLHHRDAGFFQFGRDRSAAASAGASRRGENDRIDAVPFGLFRYLSAEAACVRQRIRSAASRNEFGMQLADDAVFLHLAHGVEGHQPVGIFLHESGVVAAVGNFIVFAAQIVGPFDVVRTPMGRGGAFDPIGIALRHKPAIRDQHDFRLR